MGNKLLISPDLCVSCRICEMSCSLEKSGMFNPVKSRIRIKKNKKLQYVPFVCRQCKSAPCEKACPVKDSKPIQRDRDANIVRLDLENCDNCYECVDACSFGAMRIDPHSKQLFKCDLCNGDPECVKWCPTGAIVFTEKEANRGERFQVQGSEVRRFPL